MLPTARLMYMITVADVRTCFGMALLTMAIEIGEAPPRASPARKR